ncbi:MAG: transcription antitermination factor NusB [Marinilabiliales bacterium]
MISRRLLRIKILHALYAYYKSDSNSITKSEKELLFSIEKTYELFHYLLMLILEIEHYAYMKIELRKEKKIPTYEDLHPNTKFIDNKLIKQIKENKQFQKYINDKKLSWANYPELIKILYNRLIDSDFYNSYMNDDSRSYSKDKAIVISIYEKIIPEEELLFQILEEQSIYWNDDVEFVISVIIKTLYKFKPSDSEFKKLPELYKNDEDRDFVKQLFRSCIKNHEYCIDLIEKHSKNWDIERIAFMDILLIEMATTEILNIETIPVKVSFNEYIDLAKFYSTDKSSIFVNGVLDKIIQTLRKENKIVKRGRGLIGEI